MRGERCDFLHVYDPARMPVCHLYATHGECNNKDCIFAHRAVDERAEECPFYNRGFCSKGAACRLPHVARLPCALYLQGFCPEGPSCQHGHPKFELPDLDDDAIRMPEQPRTVRARGGARQSPRGGVPRSRPAWLTARLRACLTLPTHPARPVDSAGPLGGERAVLQVLAPGALRAQLLEQADTPAAAAPARCRPTTRLASQTRARVS